MSTKASNQPDGSPCMCFLFRHELKRYMSLLKMMRSNHEAFSGRVVQGSNDTVAATVAVPINNTATVDALISTSGKIIQV